MKYVNAGHSLNVDSGHVATLRFKSVTACPGWFGTSDKFYFAGNYVVSTPTGLTIS